MKKATFTCLALALSGMVQAQTAPLGFNPTPTATPLNLINANPLGRDFLTPDSIAQAQQQARVITSPAPTAPGTPALSKATSSMSSPPAPGTIKSTGTMAVPAPAIAPVTVTAGTAVVRPRFIQDSDPNHGTVSYYESKAAAKEQYYAGSYGQRSPATSPSSRSTEQMGYLAPIVESLRNRGVEEGKISLELNRLTPVQFAHWAAQSQL